MSKPRSAPRAREDDGGSEISLRERIIGAATALFAMKGLAGVSIADVSSHLGVSPASISRHFKNKAALYEASIRNTVRDARQHVDASEGESILDSLARYFVRHPLQARLLGRMLVGGETGEIDVHARVIASSNYDSAHFFATVFLAAALVLIGHTEPFKSTLGPLAYGILVTSDKRLQMGMKPWLPASLQTLNLAAAAEQLADKRHFWVDVFLSDADDRTTARVVAAMQRVCRSLGAEIVEAEPE